MMTQLNETIRGVSSVLWTNCLSIYSYINVAGYQKNFHGVFSGI